MLLTQDFIREEQTYREWVKETLTEINTQTLKTNGRVSKLEKWQSYVLGFCACMSLLFLSIAIPFMLQVFSSHVH